VYPPWAIPRRRDDAEVILFALLAAAAGSGHRRIATLLVIPQGTVRGWLRRARTLAEAIRARSTRWAHALDPELGPTAPSGWLAEPVSRSKGATHRLAAHR
jgi:hypothetical protein